MATNKLNWMSCKNEFKPDGSLRDIYIPHTTLEDWESFYKFLLRRDQSFQYSRSDNQKVSLPSTAAEVFQDTRCVHTLSIDIGGVFLNCHFFTVKQIELDFDPEYVNSQARLDVVLNFMREAGRLLEKEVLLTPENGIEVPICRYFSDKDIVTFRNWETPIPGTGGTH